MGSGSGLRYYYDIGLATCACTTDIIILRVVFCIQERVLSWLGDDGLFGLLAEDADVP